LEEGDSWGVFHMYYASPIFFISERDLVDKKIEFENENKLYFIATSVTGVLDEIKDVVRCKNYLNSVILSEDEDNFYYNGLNQLDAKVFLLFINRHFCPRSSLTLHYHSRLKNISRT
jgi:hypothetical protein